MISVLLQLETWAKDIPPVHEPQRFGNRAFRDWIARLEQVRCSFCIKTNPHLFY